MGAIFRGGAQSVLTIIVAAFAVGVPLGPSVSEEGRFEGRQPATVDYIAYEVAKAFEAAARGDSLAAASLLADAATDRLLPELYGKSPDWLKRVEFQWQWNEDAKADFSLLTVQPLFQTDDRRETVFTQVRLTRNHQFGDARLTSNFGIGYRRLLLNNTVLAGINGFLDREWTEDHNRLGVGLEVKWYAFDLAFNYYEAFGGSVGIAPGISETPLDGYNFEVTAQIPYLPWARARVSMFEFFSRATSDNLNGFTAGIELDLHQNVQVEFGYTDDDRNDNLAFVRVNVRMGDGLLIGPKGRYLISRHPIDDVAFRMRDMRAHTLDKVRRIDTIVVERVSAGIVISRAN